MFMFEIFKGYGLVYITYICSLVLCDIINKIMGTFHKKPKIYTFYDIHEEYWTKFAKLDKNDHESKQVLTKWGFDEFMKIIDSKFEFNINEPDEHGFLVLEYVLTLYDSLEYAKKLINEMEADPTKTGKNDIPMVSWIAKMSNAKAYEYWLNKDYHNVPVPTKYNVFCECVSSRCTTLREKHDFLKMLNEMKFKLDSTEISQYVKRPTVCYFTAHLGTHENFRDNNQLLLETMKIVLDLGANIDEQNQDGLTGLMQCAKYDHLYLNKAKLYVALGANLYIVDKDGKNAHGLAESYNMMSFLSNVMLSDLLKKIEKLEEQVTKLNSKFEGTIIEC